MKHGATTLLATALLTALAGCGREPETGHQAAASRTAQGGGAGRAAGAGAGPRAGAAARGTGQAATTVPAATGPALSLKLYPDWPGGPGSFDGDGPVERWHTIKQELVRGDKLEDTLERLLTELELRVNDSRRSIVLDDVPGSWSADVVIPPEATLCFSTRADLPDLGRALIPLAWRVRFEPEGGGRGAVDLWSRVDALRPPDGGPWMDWNVDLSKLAGRRGRLTFSVAFPEGVEGPAPPELKAAIGMPAIGTAADRRPNVLLISVDTLRRDALSIYGADPALTPNLVELASHGVVVDRAWSAASWTLPSYSSLFTAEYPSTHQSGRDFSRKWTEENAPLLSFSNEVENLVERFDRAGYHTQAFHHNGHLTLNAGIERGFDGYLHYAYTGRTAVHAFDEWLNTLGHRPFFCFLHLVDPHSPYVPSQRFQQPEGTPDPRDVESTYTETLELRSQGVPEADREPFKKLYAAEVAYVDVLVGQILAALDLRGLRENTLVVFHADHGEELWDHGSWYHGTHNHAELVRIPLVYSWPKELPSGVRIPGDFRGVDVLPTAMDLVGLWDADAEDNPEGRSLAHLLRGEPGVDPPPALSESVLYSPEDEIALTSWPWRLLLPYEEPVELYDLESDPTEQHNLAEEYPDRVKAMRAAAEHIRDRAIARRRGKAKDYELDPDVAKSLGSIGYGGK